MKNTAKLLLLCALGLNAQNVVNPRQFGAFVSAMDPTAPSLMQQSFYYGYQLTNRWYATTRIDFGITASRGLEVTCATENAYRIAWQNNPGYRVPGLALVVSGGAGVGVSDQGRTGGCFDVEGAAVFGVHTFQSTGITVKGTVGMREIKSTISPNSWGPVFGLIFTMQ
jgi:hypothetical protein